MSVRIRVFLRAAVVFAVAVVSPLVFGATVTWDAGGADDDWSTPANWSTNLVPTSSDDVIIPNVGVAVLVDMDPTVNSLTIQLGGSVFIDWTHVLTVNNASTVDGTLFVHSSTLAGNGALTVNGFVEVHAGTISGSGALNISSSGQLLIFAQIFSPSVISRTTTNAGTIEYNDGGAPGFNFPFTFNGATLTNTGAIDIFTDHDIDPGPGSPILNNNSGGVITKFGSGSTAINFPVNNAAGATIQVQAGTLVLNDGGTVGGAYSISSGDTLSLSGGTFTSSNPTVSIAGGTLDTGAGVDVTWTDVTLSGGTITGAGDLHVSGNFAWSGGTISGGGLRELESTSTPTISCSAGNCMLDGAALQLQASTTFNASTNALVFSNGASLTIDPGKTLVITSTGDFSSGGGATSSIVNNGTIWKQTFGLSIVGVPVTLSGTSTVDIDDGPMQFAGGASVDAGATFDITSGEALEITGGVFLFNTGNFTVASGEVRVSGTGTLRVPTGATLTMPFVTLVTGGVIDGGGTVISSGTINWNGGTMGSAAAPGGITQINSGSTIFIGGVGAKSLTQTRQLLNNGTVSYSSGGVAALTMSGNSKITNNSTLNLTADGGINVSGSALIENYGTLTKTGGAGTSTFFPRVENNNGATVSAAAGTIVLSGGGIAAGDYAISSGRTLILDAGTFTVDSTATVTGAGTFSIAGATLDAGVGVNLTCPNVTISGGTITGAGDLHVSGNFNWLGGTILGPGARVLDSSSTPAISCLTGHCNLDDAALQMNASGTFNATTNSLVFANAASLVIASGKTLDITTDGTIVGTAVGVGTITNNGTITKSGGPGLRSISTVLHNNGSVTVTSGGLSLLANGTHGGSFTVTAPGSMLFDGGTHTIAGGISGNGILAINGATVTLNATGNAGNLVMSGGTLGGSGTLTLANGGTWSGGTMSGSGTTAVAAGQTLTVSGFPTLNGRALDLNSGAMLDITSQRLEVASAASVTGSGTLRVNGGTLRVLTGVTQTIPNVTLAAGVADGAGALHVSGNFNWLGGTIAGGGARVLNSTSVPTISCSSGNCLLDGANLQLQASGTYSASSNALMLSNGASLILDPGRGLHVNNDGDILNGGGAASSIVIGDFAMGFRASIHKTTTSGTSIIGVPVTISGGAFNLDAGTLRITAGVTVNTGNVVPIIDYDPGCTIEVTGGVFLFNTFSNLPLNGDFKVSGGTLRVSTGVTITVPNLMLESGVVDGAGDLHVSSNFTWSGGTISGSGSRVLNSTSTPAISCSAGNCQLDGGTLRLQAWGTYNASSNALVLSNGASLILDPGQVLFVSNDGDFVSGGGAASSIVIGGFGPPGVNGCIEKTTTSGTSIIGVPVTMSGSFKTVTGTLQAAAGVTAAAGAIVHYDPGTTVEVTGGLFLLASGVSFPANGAFKVSGGTLRIPASVALTIPNVTLQGSGVIDGGGTLNLSGTSTWAGGTMGSATAPGGITQVNSGNTLNITNAGSQTLTQGRELLNAGTVNYSGTSTLTMSAGGKITNNANFNLTADGNISVSGSATIDNNGTLIKSGGSGTSTLFPVVNSSGTVSATTGTLALAGGGTPYTDVVPSAPATIAFPSGTHSILGTIAGTGTLAISGATVTVDNPFTVGALSVTAGTATLDANGSVDAFSMTGGTLGGSGTLTLSNGGTWSGGTMGGSGETVNPAAKTLSISAPVTLNRALQNDGTLTVSGDITGSGTIDNGGTLNALANLTIGVTLNNSGQVVTSNALSLAGGGTHTGSFTVTTPGSLSFASGTHSVSGGSIGGTGTLAVSGAAVTVGSPFTIGALSVTAGTATLNANGSADAFTMTGGSLGGSGTLTLTNGGTWSGGTMSGSGMTVIPATMSLDISAPVTLNSRTLHNDGTLTVSGDITGSGAIDNGGTLNAAGNITIGVTVNNSGQVVTSNALTLAAGGTHTGSFNVTAPGSLSFPSGAHSLSGGGSIGGTGTLSFDGATATIGVPVNVGALSVSAGTATLNDNGSADAFTMTGGTLGGSGMLTLSNGGTWSGGTMSGTGTTVNPATKSFGISAPVTLTSRTLQNDGTLTVSANVSGSGTIANNGTLSPVGNIAIGAALNNNGQIATSAVLSLGGSGAHSGTFTVTAPGVINFSGGTQTISGTLAGTGTLRFSGAAATVNGTWTGMPIEVTGGSAALNTNGTIPALTLSGGALTGSGDVIVSGPSTWSGGTLAGSGDFKFDTGATVTMPGTNLATLARGLLNEGTIHFTAASNGMLIDGARLRNYGTFDIQSSQTIAATAGTPSFVNGGTLKKSSGEGVMQFGAPLSNSGLVRIESGTMHFGVAYAQSAGRTTVLSSAKLQAATVSLNGGFLTGNGTVAGTVANSATVSPGSSPGTLTVSGDYVQSSGGTLEIQLGGTAPGTQYDRLLVSGSVTLAGTLDVTTTNGFTPTTGNAFQILTFGSRTGSSTFDVMNGLNGLVPVFSANDLQLVSQVVVPVAADVAVGVNGPGSTIAGKKVIYTVTVSNSGPDTATNIAVTATASPGLTFSANSGACVGSFPCNIATLGPGQSATIHSAWDIAPSATGSVQLTVNASSAADPNTSNNSDSAVTNIGTCPAITIVAPSEMTTGLTAEATATGFDGAEYHWSIVNGTISRGNGTAGIEFIAGEPGTTTLTVNVTGGGCSLSAARDVTVKPRCIGTAMPITPADAVIADAVVDFAWSVVDDASGYRLWLQQGSAPAQNLGTSLGTSRTKIIPPGTYQWYVETLFDGCASHESERRTLTILPAQDCASREKPQLIAPANELPATSAAVAFSWNAVPQALEYELWLALAGGVPTLIRSTSDTFHTAVVPPGRLEWYVRAIFAGCAATESAHRAFTYTPPAECTNERPLRIAPLEGERLTSPVSFEWTGVSGATSYELYVDGELATTTTSPHASGVALPRAERRWRVRALLGGNCGAVDSAESRLVVIAPSPSCAPLAAPALSAPSQISSGTAGRIQWSFVPGATAYEVEISGDPQFPRGASSTSTVTARQMPITFTNLGGAPVERYVRVHAVDTNCVQPGRGAFSPVAAVSVLPPAGSATGNEGVALLTDPTDVPYTLNIGAELAGQSFTATPTVPWLTVTPAGGIVPPGGQTLLAVAHTAGLPAGSSIADVEITTTAPAGALRALAATPPVKLTISLNNIPGFTTTPKSTPPPDALVFPAVASVRNFVVRYDSDIHVTNTSAKEMSYEINFVPTGPAGMKEGKKTNIDLKPGATLPVRDIVKTWFGGRNSMTGTMEVRPLTETDTSTSSAPVGGLSDRITFASSRTFSTTAGGGTYGQYIPAVPYANFIDQGRTLSLQHVAQSDDKYRTNLGLVEGSGDEVVLEVRVFDAAGAERASFPVGLAGGERKQLDSVLSEHGVQLDDGRIEVEVISGAGKVTAYASVLDKVTNDPQFVPPVTLGNAGHSKWVVPGVADLVSDSGNWQTDLRIFNAGTEPADLTLAFYSMNGGPPTTGTIQLAAGKVSQLDRILFTFFGIARDAGALHISSAAPAQIVATARTYKQTPGGDYGQFIAALTPDDAVAAGTRPLQILQMEESRDFKSNIGFAEVSGKPVTLEVTVFTPNSTDRTVRLKLEPNQFQQLNLNSLFASFDLGALYNARISVSAVAGEGEGRALAYGSLIDLLTGDPTYIPGQ